MCLKNYLLAILSFGISIIAFLIITSLVFAYTNINDVYMDSAIFLAMALSAFISSFFLCKKIKKNGLIHGVSVNLICVLIIYIISSILNGKIVITNTLGIYLAICALTGIVGGILGVNV